MFLLHNPVHSVFFLVFVFLTSAFLLFFIRNGVSIFLYIITTCFTYDFFKLMYLQFLLVFTTFPGSLVLRSNSVRAKPKIAIRN